MYLSELTVGACYGPSHWMEIAQSQIDAFATATDDHQWIHVDPQRAAHGPFGTTIAHGWLSLALAAPVIYELLPFENATLVNYGAERVRFPAVVPVNSRVRGTVEIAALEPRQGGVRVSLDLTLEREGGDKPVCVARLLVHATEAT